MIDRNLSERPCQELLENAMSKLPLLLDSITDAGDDAAGKIVVSGSHGGLYPAAIASQAQVLAVLFNDAGIGLNQAGVAGVMALADTGMAAAAVDCQSCYIGAADDMWDRGRISVTNEVAEMLGVCKGMAVADACVLLKTAPVPTSQLPAVNEARSRVVLGNITIELLDSASLVTSADAAKILITGSHGALIGADPKRALKAAAKLAVFNDAGFGAGDVGVTRLPALDQQGVAAVTVSANTARIGDAKSALKTGVISACNETAIGMQAKAGIALEMWLRQLDFDETSR